MNQQECWRKKIQEANHFQAKNHSLSSKRINRELQGERRLDPSPVESRAQRRKDKNTLDRVRSAIIDGDYGNIKPQQIGEDIAYLRTRGYTDKDMLTKPTIEISFGMSVMEVAAAAD